MKKLLYVLIVFALGIISGCEKKDDGLIGPNNPEEPKDPIPSEDMISDDFVPIDWSKVKINQYDDSNGLLSLSLTEQTRTLRQGQVLTIANDTISYVLIINDVKVGKNDIILKTKQGDLCDIFANTNITLSTELTKGRTTAEGSNIYHPVKITFKDEDGQIVTESRSASDESTRLTGHLWDWNNDGREIIFYDKDGAKLYLDNPNYAANLDLKMDLNFGGRTKLQWLDNGYKRYKSEALEINTTLIGTIDNSSILRAEAKGKIKYKEDDDEIFKHNVFKPCNVTFNIGGAVIVVTISADLFRGASIEAEGEIQAYAGYEQKITGTAQLHWKQADGILSPSTGFEYTERKIPPTVKGNGTLKAEAWFFPRIYLSLYGAIGPSFDIKPYIGSELKAGFKASAGGNSDYITWQLRNYLGLELSGGLSLKFMNYEVDHKEIAKFKVFEKDLYMSPAAIDLRDSPANGIDIGQTGNVEFNVYDKDLFGNLVTTILPIRVQFEADGNVSPTHGIATNGIVATNWTPIAEDDILSATLYDSNGNIIDQARVNTQLKNEGSPVHTEYYDDPYITSFTLTNNLPTYDNYNAVNFHIPIPAKFTINLPHMQNISDFVDGTIEIRRGDRPTDDKYNGSLENDWATLIFSSYGYEDTFGSSINIDTSLDWDCRKDDAEDLEFLDFSNYRVEMDLWARFAYHTYNYSNNPPDQYFSGTWVKQHYSYSRKPKITIGNIRKEPGYSGKTVWRWDVNIDGAFWMYQNTHFDAQRYHITKEVWADMVSPGNYSDPFNFGSYIHIEDGTHTQETLDGTENNYLFPKVMPQKIYYTYFVNDKQCISKNCLRLKWDKEKHTISEAWIEAL